MTEAWRVDSAKAAAALVAVVAVVYTASRAASVGFTYDEAYSFLHFVGAPPGTVVGFRGEVNANNHTLNSLLMTLAARALGTSELALRLPNFIAFVGYGVAVLFVMRRLRHVTSKTLAAVLLLLNPFLLEIFSLARGYGLALSFVMGSIAALAAAVDPGCGERMARRRLTQAAGLAGLSVFANLAFLNYFLPFVLVVAALRLRLWRREVTRSQAQASQGGRLVLALASPAVLLGVVGIYAGPAVWRLRELQSLYYGGRTGFWSDTVGSLIRSWLYVQPYSAALEPVLWALVLVVLATCAALALGPARGERPTSLDLLRSLAFVAVAGAAISVLEHLRFGTPYLINRTASWLLPCFLLVLVLEAEVFQEAPSRTLRVASAALGWALIVASVAHLAHSANVRYAILQYQDADTKEMLQDLEGLRAKGLGSGRPIRLLASWELTPVIEYYRVTRPLGWLESVTDTPGPADAAFLSRKDLGLRGGMTDWKRYPRTGNLLVTTLGPGLSAPDE